MLRRMKLMFLGLMLLCAWAAAEEEARLPQAVLELSESVHLGYTIAAHDGWGDESRGQFALILKQGDDNILCIAEKTEEDAAYQMTVDNTNAVYDGDQLPSLLIDTGGDSLWYTYVYEGDSSAHYGTLKENGQWGRMSVLSYWPKEDGFTGIWGGVSDGMLCYEETDEDENENIRDRWMYAPIEVSQEFAQSLELRNFDINTFDTDPRDGLYPLLGNDAFVHSQTMAGYPLRDMDISTVHLAKLFEMSDGLRLLRVDDWDGTFYHTAALLRFADGTVMDTYHAGDGQVIVDSGGMTYSIERVDEGSWVMHGVDAESGVRAIGPDYAAPDGQTTVYRNDEYIYGASPWDKLPRKGAPVMPETAPLLVSSYEVMAAQMDPSAYALVNNPNPEDRLHLRAKPDKGAHSYGKFYNRTPVRVLERGDTWTKVQIGCGGAAMTGYMMTKFLVFDEKKKAELACAFPQKLLLEGHPNGVHMYAEPRETAVTDRVFKQSSGDFIIGVSGNEWFIVLRADGAVGYVPQHAFWDGNG